MRLAVIIAIVALAVLMIAAAIVPLLIPTEQYRASVERRLARDFDARVTMEGFRLRLIPYPGYTIRGLGLLSTAEPFRGQRLLWARKVTGSLALGALLRGRAVTAVTLHDAEIDYRREGEVNNLRALVAGRFGRPAAEDERPLDVTRLELADGRLNVIEGGAIVRQVNRLDLVFENLFPDRGLAATVEAAAAVIDPKRRDAGFQGKLFFDPARGEFAVREGAATFAGSRFVLDASVNFNVDPPSFDVHLATPAIGKGALAALVGERGAAFLKGFAWEGQIALDAQARGTRALSECTLGVDASQARLELPPRFVKGAGLAFKLAAAFTVQPERITLGETSLLLSDDEIALSGTIDRAAPYPAKLAIAGGGLDAASLKLFLPALRTIGALDGLALDLSLAGPLLEKEPLALSGNFRAERAELAGFAIADLSGSLERTAEGYSLAALKGRAGEGTLAGTGTLVTGETDRWTVDAVVDGVETQTLAATAGVLSGTGTLVLSGKGSGADPADLAQDFALDGTLVMKQATFMQEDAFGSLFTTELPEAIGALAGEPIAPEAAAALAEDADALKELKAAFISTKGALDISECTWSTTQFTGALAAQIDAAGSARGEGTLTLPRPVAAKLVPGVTARKRVTDDTGRMVVPIALAGERAKLAVRLDQVALDALAAKRAPEKPAGKPATVVREESQAKPKAPTTPASKKEQTSVKRTAPQPIRRRAVRPPARRSTPSKPTPPPDDDFEAADILKVIIGK